MQKYANLLELEKCYQTHIFLQDFVLIQPRTSPPKICKLLVKIVNFASLLLVIKLFATFANFANLVGTAAAPARPRTSSTPRTRSPRTSSCTGSPPTASPGSGGACCMEARGRANARQGSFEALYRGQILQANMRLKALAKIYTMHCFAQL